MISLVCGRKNNNDKNQTYGCRLVVARGGAWKVREVGEDSPKVVTSSYKGIQ